MITRSIFIKEEKRSLLRELLESDDELQKSPSPEPEILPDCSDKEEDAPKPVVPSVRQMFRRTLTKLKISQLVVSKKKKVVNKPDPRDTLGLKVAQMSDGVSFGELALQNSDNKRAASCVTDTDVRV